MRNQNLDTWCRCVEFVCNSNGSFKNSGSTASLTPTGHSIVISYNIVKKEKRRDDTLETERVVQRHVVRRRVWPTRLATDRYRDR